MKTAFSVLRTAVFLAALSASATDSAGLRLLWSDEFDGEGLPDAAEWNYEHGHIRNREPQFFTTNRVENIRREDGNLVITVRREKFPNELYKEGSDDWRYKNKTAGFTSACVESRRVFRYGRIECRAKVPGKNGMWPAFWMMGDGLRAKTCGWPACGEIDIMEYYGKGAPDQWGNVWRGKTTAALHYSSTGFPWWRAPDGNHLSKGAAIDAVPYDGFHVYALEWTPETLRIFYDDRLVLETPVAETVGSESGSSPFQEPHFIILNLSLGGWMGNPVDEDMTSENYLVDYVRVYELPDVECSVSPPERASKE